MLGFPGASSWLPGVGSTLAGDVRPTLSHAGGENAVCPAGAGAFGAISLSAASLPAVPHRFVQRIQRGEYVDFDDFFSYFIYFISIFFFLNY